MLPDSKERPEPPFLEEFQLRRVAPIRRTDSLKSAPGPLPPIAGKIRTGIHNGPALDFRPLWDEDLHRLDRFGNRGLAGILFDNVGQDLLDDVLSGVGELIGRQESGHG